MSEAGLKGGGAFYIWVCAEGHYSAENRGVYSCVRCYNPAPGDSEAPSEGGTYVCARLVRSFSLTLTNG